MGLRKVRQVQLGSRIGFGSWRSGMCSWCGSTYFDRRSGYQRRHCNDCGTTFEERYPNCDNPQNSLGFNSRTQEYGCDQCRSIFAEE